MGKLIPYALKDTPNLIESGIFPVQKLSYEAQRERKSGSGQTLTGLGSYWKGRKPLILVRAVVFGLLLPKTNSPVADMTIFEKLLAFDNHGLARRAYAGKKISPNDIIQSEVKFESFSKIFDLPSRNSNKYRWKRNISEATKVRLIEQYLATLSTYTKRANLCQRPEEVNQDWLYQPIWDSIRDHYAKWGILANSFDELIEQLGILRFGNRPRVGDPFAGGGSIPFEAARVGCNIYAGDLNPVACMLNWGAINIVGAPKSKQSLIKSEIDNIYELVTNDLNDLGIDTNGKGEKAKNYLYCTETICPQTGWTIPISGSWVVSKPDRLIVEMQPNFDLKRFELKLKKVNSPHEIVDANMGSIQKDRLTYFLDGEKIENSVKSIRGDFKDKNGNTRNKLRPWGKIDIVPKQNDIFKERLYLIQWERISKSSGKIESHFCEPSSLDIEQDKKVEQFVQENINKWISKGLFSNMEIERGYNTNQPIRERGWTHWHHFFNPRQLLTQKLFLSYAKRSSIPCEMLVFVAKMIDMNNRGCLWHSLRVHSGSLFYNQALNTLWNYSCRSGFSHAKQWKLFSPNYKRIPTIDIQLACRPASTTMPSDIFISDPPYADAVCYHEIFEIFISWFKSELPHPFSEWTWDSRRTLAIKGEGIEFRKSMTEAYSSMANNMPENGYQCVMFTHSSVKVWVDITNILWASRLQVVSAWCVATETATSFRDGNHIQGTVLLVLKKRQEEKSGFKQHILPKIRSEVERQIYMMMNISGESKYNNGDTLFSDADLRMAGQAAALKILTSYTTIDGEDVSTFVFQSSNKQSHNAVAEIVTEAIDIANNILVPEKLNSATWSRLTGVERFYLRLMDLDVVKLDTFQNFSKAFRVSDYSNLLSSKIANKAKLKLISEFDRTNLAETTKLGESLLGKIIVALQQLSITNTEPEYVSIHLQNSVQDFVLVRDDLINLLAFIEIKSPESEIREAATILIGQLRNLRILNQ